MSLAPLSFTGISSFSTDFQTILTRAVSIASIPLKSLQNSDSDTLQRKTLLSSLGTAVGDFGNSLNTLGTLGANKALAATSSNPALLSVTNTGATAPAVYTINQITAVAKAASETSVSGYANSSTTPVSSTGTIKLLIASKSYTINLASGQNNLIGVQNAINALGVGVTASIITSGTGANPNFLSLTSNNTGATTLQLRDDPTGANTSLLTASNQGSDAAFQLNGINFTRASNTVNDAISGLTFTIVGPTTGTALSLTLATDRNQIANGLQNFVTSYNSLVGQIGTQVGRAAGLLSGDFIVRQIQNDLRSVGSYRLPTGNINSLSDLGITFSNTGQASFSSATFNGLSESQLANAITFLGSTSTGFGGQAGIFAQLTDPISGLIKLEQNGFDTTDTRLQKQISVLTERINQLQASLRAQLQAADTNVARLQNQQNVLTASLKGVSLVLFGKSSSGN